VNKYKYTPENIVQLGADEVFVFGSNPEGRHNSGAAKTAKDKFGAIYGCGIGMQGRSYAIPTKDMQKFAPLPLDEIEDYVDEFLYFALHNKHICFLVTKIGCGLAGLEVKDIATMFIGFSENVTLPKEFVMELNRLWNESDEVMNNQYS